MGLILTTTAGLIVWVCLWATGTKALDAFLITLTMVLIAATLRMLLRYLPGRRDQELPPPGA